MKNSFIYVIFVLLVLGAVAYSIKGRKVVSKEGFGTQNLTWRNSPVTKIQSGVNKGEFVSIPNFQSILSPRFSTVSYGSSIRQNFPDTKYLGSPLDPLTYGAVVTEGYKSNGAKKQPRMTKENYCASGCDSDCNDYQTQYYGVQPTPPDYSEGNYKEITEKVYADSNYPTTTSLLPVGDMTTVNPLGEPVQVVQYNNMMYANRNSRLRSAGDMIRGDIAPCDVEGRQTANMFRIAVNPTIDLQTGALNVIGGVTNETSRALAAYLHNYSGNTNTTFGGVNMASDFNTSLGNGQSDVTVSSFP